MPLTKQTANETDGRKRRARRANTAKLSQMTIDQYIAAVEEWQKQGEALKTEGQRFQAALNNVGFGIRVPTPQQTFMHQSYPQPARMPVTVAASDSDISKDNGSTTVSLSDPMLQQSELQESISQQLNQANSILAQKHIANIDPF